MLKNANYNTNIAAKDDLSIGLKHEMLCNDLIYNSCLLQNFCCSDKVLCFSEFNMFCSFFVLR